MIGVIIATILVTRVAAIVGVIIVFVAVVVETRYFGPWMFPNEVAISRSNLVENSFFGGRRICTLENPVLVVFCRFLNYHICMEDLIENWVCYLWFSWWIVGAVILFVVINLFSLQIGSSKLRNIVCAA